MNKKVMATLILTIALALYIGVTIVEHKMESNWAINAQMQLLNNIDYVENYTTDGTTVVIYVNDLWLVPSNEEHIKWIKTLGQELDRIYCDKTNRKDRGHVGLHIYRDNKDGTMTELARYKVTGETELYYKH